MGKEFSMENTKNKIRILSLANIIVGVAAIVVAVVGLIGIALEWEVDHTLIGAILIFVAGVIAAAVVIVSIIVSIYLLKIWKHTKNKVYAVWFFIFIATFVLALIALILALIAISLQLYDALPILAGGSYILSVVIELVCSCILFIKENKKTKHNA